MQELKSDLLTAIDTCNEALEEIKDLQIKKACQAVVNLTIDNILNRIDTELLEMEKEQIENAYNEGVYLAMTPSKTAEDYYQQTFKNK